MPFLICRYKIFYLELSEMRLRHSVALMDILDELTDKISKMDGTPKLLQILYDGLSAIEQRLSAGCSERIQSLALISVFIQARGMEFEKYTNGDME